MGMVRISSTMSINATVRCPHCQQSFVLSDLLDQSLPPLEVVATDMKSEADNDHTSGDAPYIDTLHLKRGEQVERPEKPRVKFEIPKALRDGAKRKRRRRRRSSSSNGSTKSDNFVIPSASESGDSSTAAGSTTMGEAVERRRSSSGSSQRSSSSGQRSGSRTAHTGSGHRGKVETHVSRLQNKKPEINILGMIKVAVGSLFAFMMAYLMLIWIFKADPLGVAPNIAKSIPFAIPSSMQDGGKPEVIVDPEPERELPSYLVDDEDVEPFVPRPLSGDGDRIAVPDIDPDEVFGQEFGL